MSIDSIGNFLTVIRNGLMVQKRSVTVQFSKQKYEIAKVLKEEGYIKDFQQIEDENKKPALSVVLKYVDGESVIQHIIRMSSPGRRSYKRASGIDPVIGGLGISILTTSSGLMTDREARKKGVGGEIICQVW
jgi:small subunit ribosomal protein S8